MFCSNRNATGETVADVCRRYGISRDTYYRYRRPYLAEGIEGLQDRSRKPKTSPNQISAEVEIRIVEMRTAHPRWGARRIRAELAREGVDAPAVSTVHQALRRNGLVAPQPSRRPVAGKRFEREISNDLWQIDATQRRVEQITGLPLPSSSLSSWGLGSSRSVLTVSGEPYGGACGEHHCTGDHRADGK
jgi:transposase